MSLQIISTTHVHPTTSTRTTSTLLSILDSSCARFSPTGAIFLFDPPDISSPLPEPQLLKNFETSLRATLDSFPHFAGQLQWAPCYQDAQTITDRTGRAMVTYGASESDPGVEFTTARLPVSASDLAPDSSTRASGSQVWLNNTFSQDDLLSSKTPLALADLKTYNGLPAMLVQITILQDGAYAVATKMAHLLGDASTLILFMRHWADACKVLQRKGQATEPPVLEVPVFDPDALDSRAPGVESRDEELVMKAAELPLHRFDWWATYAEGYPPFLKELAESNKPDASSVLEMAMKETGSIPPWMAWDMLRPVSHALIHYSPKQIEELRSRISSVAGDGARPSRLDAVLAHAWAAINRARELSESDEEVFLNITMGVRGRVNPPLPDAFVGSPLLMAHISAKGREAARVRNKQASCIRECVNKFTPAAVGAFLHRSLHEVSPPQRFWQAFLGRYHVLVTAWLRLGANEINFHDDGKQARYVHPVMPLVDGCLLVVDGGAEEGDMALSLYLESEAMQRLLQDSALLP